MPHYVIIHFVYPQTVVIRALILDVRKTSVGLALETTALLRVVEPMVHGRTVEHDWR